MPHSPSRCSRTARGAQQPAHRSHQRGRASRQAQLRPVRHQARQSLCDWPLLPPILPAQVPAHLCNRAPARRRRHPDSAAMDSRTHQRCESTIEKLLELSALAVAIDRSSKERAGHRRHHDVPGPGGKVGNRTVETHSILLTRPSPERA